MNIKHYLISGCLLLFTLSTLEASGRTEAGLTLLEAPSARASSLGEAYSSVTDDIGAFAYNPSSLATLKSRQISLTYQQGLVDDSFGHFSYGLPKPRGSFGVFVSYYDGGETDVFDGTTSRNVTTQTDFLLGLGYARTYNRVSLGASAKYFSSEIADTTKATAFMGDFGALVSIVPRLTWGASFQNIGSTLKYDTRSNDLPRLFRTGVSYQLVKNNFSSFIGKGIYSWIIFVDGVYHMNTAELNPSFGIEINVTKSMTAVIPDCFYPESPPTSRLRWASLPSV